MGQRKHVLHGGTMAPPGDYDWTIRVLRRHSLMSNYFDHFFSFISNTTPWTNLYDIVRAVPSIRAFHVCLQSVQITYCKQLTTELLKSSETRQTKMKLTDYTSPALYCIHSSRCSGVTTIQLKLKYGRILLSNTRWSMQHTQHSRQWVVWLRLLAWLGQVN